MNFSTGGLGLTSWHGALASRLSEWDFGSHYDGFGTWASCKREEELRKIRLSNRCIKRGSLLCLESKHHFSVGVHALLQAQILETFAPTSHTSTANLRVATKIHEPEPICPRIGDAQV